MVCVQFSPSSLLPSPFLLAPSSICVQVALLYPEPPVRTENPLSYCGTFYDMLFQLILVAFSLVGTLAVPTPHDSHDGHSHNVRKSLPNAWYQRRDHPVHALFERATTDGTDYPTVGTPGTFVDGAKKVKIDRVCFRMVSWISHGRSEHKHSSSGVGCCTECCHCSWKDSRRPTIKEYARYQPGIPYWCQPQWSYNLFRDV
jgi:hypothetical protein